jgi:GNAT superfamily N-acetyltransferase
VNDSADLAIRPADVTDAETIGQLLHHFNREFDEPTQGQGVIAERIRQLLDADQIAVLLGGTEPHGLVLLRFCPALYADAVDCCVEELYVVPGRRGQGLGRALMEGAIALARGKGAADMYLRTGEDDTAARALYERLGFSNRGGRPNGPVNYFYEREL